VRRSPLSAERPRAWRNVRLVTAAVQRSTIPAHAVVGMSLTRPSADSAAPAGAWHRTVVVVGDDPELVVALRDRLDRAMVTVCEVRPDDAAAAVRGCTAWPWMVVGDTRVVDEPFARALAAHPIVAIWRGQVPPGLPGHVRVAGRFSELAAAVESAVDAQVRGVRLAVGSGLSMPDGSHTESPVLEALVASHPLPVPASPRQLRAADAVLSAHHVPLMARRAPGGGVLVPAGQA
jgi:hypothetical protein